MASIITTTISCDLCGTVFDTDEPNLTLQNQRLKASACGWVCKSGDTDKCPDCRKTKKHKERRTHDE